jgi:tetratricopeptide (TPR) repeat protein
MSIIADTLKRLQTQTEDPAPNRRDDPIPRPAFNKGEGSGRHRKDSPFGFLMVMVGMTLTLGGLAFAAFWIGGHLDFGLATNTQARVNTHRFIPKAIRLPEDPIPVDHSSETLMASAEQPTQIPQILQTWAKKEKNQITTKVDTDRSSIPPLPLREGRAPSLFEVESTGALSTKVMMPTTSQYQQDLSRAIDQPGRSKEESTGPILLKSKEPSSITASTQLPTSTTAHPATDIATANQTDEPEAVNLIAMPLEEEIIQTEELAKTSKAIIKSSPKSANLAAVNAGLESTNHATKTATPFHPSSNNQLRHAQQLIRSGKYEDAVALLSPLFHDPPVMWQPWFWMGTALLGKGDMEQADQFFLSGLARNDKVPQLWIQRALVAQQRGDYQLAIHELRQAESLEADIPHIHLNMGYAYEQLGNGRMANQYYAKFLKLSEDNPAFFSTRKKLFARLTRQTPAEKPSPPPSLNP